MTTCTLSNLSPWLRSLFVYLCCHKVTNRPIGNSGAPHPSLTGLCGFVLDCRCVKNGKKREVEARSNFTPPQPGRYLHDSNPQLLYCCVVVAACWGWRLALMRGSGTLLSLDLLSSSILQPHLILREFDLWYRQQKSVAGVARHTRRTTHLSKKKCAFKR